MADRETEHDYEYDGYLSVGGVALGDMAPTPTPHPSAVGHARPQETRTSASQPGSASAASAADAGAYEVIPATAEGTSGSGRSPTSVLPAQPREGVGAYVVPWSEPTPGADPAGFGFGFSETDPSNGTANGAASPSRTQLLTADAPRKAPASGSTPPLVAGRSSGPGQRVVNLVLLAVSVAALAVAIAALANSGSSSAQSPSAAPGSMSTALPAATAAAATGPLQGAAVVSEHDVLMHVLAVGGQDASNTGITAVAAFDGSNWTAHSTLLHGHTGASAAVFQGAPHVLGGLAGPGLRSADVQRFDPATGAWKLSVALPSSRDSGAATVFRGHLYFLGGSDGGTLPRVDRFDGQAWEEAPPMQVARYGLGAAVFGEYLYAVGGAQGSGPSLAYLATAERFDGSVWATLPDMPSPRTDLCVVAFQGLLLAIGGNNGTHFLSSVDRFDGTAWSTGIPMGTARSGMSAATFYGLLIVAGGATMTNPANPTPTSIVERFDGTAWKELAPLSIARNKPSLVPLGQASVVLAELRAQREATAQLRTSLLASTTALFNSRQTKLTAPDAAPMDNFGWSVAVAGTTIVSGAIHDDHAGPDSGAAYVFEWTGSTWAHQQKLVALDAAANDRFGGAVDISGSTLVVGAAGTNTAGADSGSAHVFTRQANGTWTLQQKLNASDAAPDDRFGFKVGISGTTIVVSAILRDEIGNDSGAAYIFELDGGVWVEKQKLIASDADGGDQFGFSVAISGTTVVVGAFQDDDAGSASGSAYVFVRNGTASWVQQQKLTASDAEKGDEFGIAVAIDGDTVVVGSRYDNHVASDAGSAYVFSRSGSAWTEQAHLVASTGTDSHFGWAVAISGNTIVVGARHDDAPGDESGSAFVFTGAGTAWTQQAKLVALDAASGDRFGWSVAVDGTTIMVGSIFDDDAGEKSGSAYVF